MTGDKNDTRKTRLAAALKENLKRRKTRARAQAEANAAPEAKTLGVAGEAGLENKSEPGLKSAPKRN